LSRLVALELADDALQPPWLATREPVRFFLDRPLDEPPPGSRPLAYVRDGDSRKAAIVESGGARVALFDPLEAIRAVTHETYFRPRRPLHSRLPFPYQLVPGPLRLALFRLLAGSTAPGDGFPAWPHDASVEALRFIAETLGLRPERGANHAASPTGWPGGKRYAFAVSFDVDSARGRDRMPEIEALLSPLGVRATWFLVGDGYAHDHDRLAALRAAGHEIGLHGDRHDNRIAYLAPAAIERRLDRCRGFVERHEVRGFRSPSLLESPALRAALAPRFHYASQVPDSEVASLVAPRRGCCSCRPFVRQGLLEIPITLPMDDKLILQGSDERQIVELWRRKLLWVSGLGGVVQLVLHAEPHLLDRSKGPARAILEAVARDEEAWLTTLGAIAAWWQEPLRK